jgi:hypothetical protein
MAIQNAKPPSSFLPFCNTLSPYWNYMFISVFHEFYQKAGMAEWAITWTGKIGLALQTSDGSIKALEASFGHVILSD